MFFLHKRPYHGRQNFQNGRTLTLKQSVNWMQILKKPVIGFGYYHREVKVLKVKDTEKTLKAVREKQLIGCKETLISSTAVFSSETTEVRRKSEREKQIQYANTYIWNLKKKKMVMKNLGARWE